jgi:invasion protein IalB
MPVDRRQALADQSANALRQRRQRIVAAMKARTNLSIGMESVTRKPVAIPVSLAGFTAAIDKLQAIK